MVTIEESDDEKSIVTPDLRLRFTWAQDRWTHAIEAGPGPWKVIADSVEGDDLRIRPAYQEVHFQEEGDDVLALAVGMLGSHLFSASFRVKFWTDRRPVFAPSQDCSKSRIEVDVADRTRATDPVEALYQIHLETASLNLRKPVEGDQEFQNEWRSLIADSESRDSERDRADGFAALGPNGLLTWEAANHHVILKAAPAPSASYLTALTSERSDPDRVRIAPCPGSIGGTHRFGYAWEHVSILAADKPEG